jgi:hypothetical protein
LENLDLDTGKPVKPGTYRLTDETYAQLLDRLKSKPERPIRIGVEMQNVLSRWFGYDGRNAVKKDQRAWARVQSELLVLKAMPLSSPREANGE